MAPPTRSFYEFSNIFGNVSYIGNYTKAMNSTFVAYKPGQYAARSETPTLSGYKYGNFATGDEATAANAAVGLVDMSVTNVGSVNDGLPGRRRRRLLRAAGGAGRRQVRRDLRRLHDGPHGLHGCQRPDRPDPLPVLPPRPAHRQRSLAETAQDITLTVRSQTRTRT